jgi:hypothetical protein
MMPEPTPLEIADSGRGTLRALSGDAALLASLRRDGYTGRVHSVFDRVVNLQSAQGGLLTLASSDVDNAPDTLIVDVRGFGNCRLAVGDRCGAAMPDELFIGSALRVNHAGAVTWSERCPAYPDDVSTLRASLGQIEMALARDGTPGGVLPAATGDAPMLRAVHAALAQRAARTLDALSHGDLGVACESALGMIGLGPGLTPSGDDFLTGLFAVLNIERSPCHRFRRICDHVVAEAVPLTNAISLATLKAAAQGRVRESIVVLLRYSMFGSAEGVGRSLSRVLAIGSTSGTDIVAGIVAGFKVNLQSVDAGTGQQFS